MVERIAIDARDWDSGEPQKKSNGRSRQTQKSVDSGRTPADDKALVLSISGNSWLALSSWAKEQNKLLPWQRGVAYSVGTRIQRGNDPTEKMFKQAAIIIDKLRDEGVDFTKFNSGNSSSHLVWGWEITDSGLVFHYNKSVKNKRSLPEEVDYFFPVVGADEGDSEALLFHIDDKILATSVRRNKAGRLTVNKFRTILEMAFAETGSRVSFTEIKPSTYKVLIVV